MCKNVVERDRQTADGNIIKCMRFTFWIPKATDTHLEYVILIAFPRQQWLRKRASVLLYSYNACLVLNSEVTRYQCHIRALKTESYIRV